MARGGPGARSEIALFSFEVCKKSLTSSKEGIGDQWPAALLVEITTPLQCSLQKPIPYQNTQR